MSVVCVDERTLWDLAVEGETRDALLERLGFVPTETPNVFLVEN